MFDIYLNVLKYFPFLLSDVVLDSEKRRKADQHAGLALSGRCSHSSQPELGVQLSVKSESRPGQCDSSKASLCSIKCCDIVLRWQAEIS